MAVAGHDGLSSPGCHGGVHNMLALDTTVSIAVAPGVLEAHPKKACTGIHRRRSQHTECVVGQAHRTDMPHAHNSASHCRQLAYSPKVQHSFVFRTREMPEPQAWRACERVQRRTYAAALELPAALLRTRWLVRNVVTAMPTVGGQWAHTSYHSWEYEWQTLAAAGLRTLCVAAAMQSRASAGSYSSASAMSSPPTAACSAA